MLARAPAQSNSATTSRSMPLVPIAWPHQFLLFAIFFAGLMLLHAPLLRLPYFWDEAGYYIPAARDLYLSGSLIPRTTISNAHPPLVMAWLAFAWRIFGYSTLTTRGAMLVVAAFSLLGLFRLARVVSNSQVAWAVTLLTAIYPVFFVQSSLGQVDLAAAGLTLWGLLAYVEDEPWKVVLWFSMAALAKETAILAPVALSAWEVAGGLAGRRWPQLTAPTPRRTPAFLLLLPVLPLAGWFRYHYAKTGFLLGNPEFFRYNVETTVNPLRIPLAFGMRVWQIVGYLGLYVLSLATLLAMFRRPLEENNVARPRIALWQQASLGAVLVAYVIFMSAIGGAVLARYLLPVLPLVILGMVATLWRRARYWRLIAALAGVAFLASLFTNPPYGFSLEDNLAYRDYVVMHAEASRFLTMWNPNIRVLTAWPASDELTRPWLGYVARPFGVMRIENFTQSEVDKAASVRGQFDAAFVFSTKYQPRHPLLGNWLGWQKIKERLFDYHHDLSPEDIAQRLGGTIVFHKEIDGQWVAVITESRE
jgi:Dolichyl-phosphate-mannose-protein mannosyltransferase